MKFLAGIVIGAALAIGGGYMYLNCPCHEAKAEAAPTHAVVGQKAPDFTLKNQNGDMVKLSDYIGKGPIVLEWFNKDCPYVRKFYDAGEMQRLQKQEVGNGAIWLRIVSSAPGKQGFLDDATAKAVHATSNATATLIDATGDVGRLYEAKTTPSMAVIDLGGNLVYAGAIDSIKSFDAADIPNAENYVVAALDALRAGMPIKVSQTPSYGCGVKY